MMGGLVIYRCGSFDGKRSSLYTGVAHVMGGS